MVKIEKAIQPKHKETLSPWLKQFVKAAAETPLPLLPQTLDRFPSRWPFSRGDLYHWIPLLNRFDTVLERICKTYGLNEGPQQIPFDCTLLSSQFGTLGPSAVESRLEQLGFQSDGDRHLVESVLKFTRMLLEHCGNRSIYASSAHLNDLLNSTCLTVLIHTLEVGSELAQRYQASVKRIGTASKQISSALLANHYNIDLGRVLQLSQPFVKTPILNMPETIPLTTPPSVSKGKEKATVAAAGNHKHAATRHASDLVGLVSGDTQRWESWGDVKVPYYPAEQSSSSNDPHGDIRAGQPSTPTPLRRSTTATGQQSTPRGRQFNPDDSSPVAPKTPTFVEEHGDSGQKSCEFPSHVVISESPAELMKRCPADMPASAKYEVFHRLRVAKALKDSKESRQAILAVRLLAATNLAYIYHEAVFAEKVLRQDMDETRQYQLVYQLADVIHPSDGESDVPLWLQTIALALLEAISGLPIKVQEVLTAVNANVNHGILLFVIRKAVLWMKEDRPEDKGEHITEADEWRNNLFSLTLHLSMASRVGPEMVSAGLLDVLIDILKIRTKVAQRYHSMVLASLDGLIWTYANAFTAFFNAEGLDAVASLIVDSVKEARVLQSEGNGIGIQYRSSSVDYDIPFYQQQTLKWLSKFVHHMMSGSYTLGNNTDRLLRNLAEKSDVLQSLREIIQDKQTFGSVIWTSTVTILADFINNDPTSFAAISESGMIKTYLEAITKRPLPDVQSHDAMQRPASDGQAGGAESPESSSSSANADLEQDTRPHPPSDEVLEQLPREGLADGILPSSDAIGVVPMVLNSISLNHTGMKMVVASKAFESFLQIFESEQHVKCMANDRELASNVGRGFDELARHHPALRTAISNAVVDMVARVRLLGRQKARNAGWGTKLLVTTTESQVLAVTEDGKLESSPALGKLGQKPTTTTNTADADADIDMGDATPAAAATEEASKTSTDSSPSESFTPYVHALAGFLYEVMSNSILKTNFIDRGGIEILLDICESPSLSANFAETYHPRSLGSVVTQLVEQSPFRGLPSLFHRTLSAVETLTPIAERPDSTAPYFSAFLSDRAEPLTSEVDPALRDGTKIAKALLNVQTFVKILAECFTTSRSNSLQFYSVNVYDYYLRLVKSLGPLLRGILSEEAAEMTMVPESWSVAQLTEGESSSSGAGSNATSAQGNWPSDLRPGGTAWSLIGDMGAPLIAAVNGPERLSSRYQNYETLRLLLHPLTPTTFPFFQSLGRALLPRRETNPGDPYPRLRQLEIARALAETVLEHLRPSLEPPDLSSRNFHYWIIMLHTIHEMLIYLPPSRRGEPPSPQIIMPLLLAFKEEGGFEVLGRMMEGFLSTVRGRPGQKTDGSPLAKVAAFGVKKMLDLFTLLCNGKYITESGGHYSLLKQADRSAPIPNTYQQIVLEIRADVVPILNRVWDTAVVDKVPDTTVKRIIEVLKLVVTGENELQSIAKDKPPFALFKDIQTRFNWAPLEGLVDDLVHAGYDSDLANEAAYRVNGHASTAREYCRAHKNGIAGPRNPVPSEDADKTTASESANLSREHELPNPNTGQDTDAMSLDAPPEIPEEILRDPTDGASILANAIAQFSGLERPPSAGPAPANGDAAKDATELPETHLLVAVKEKLDQFRQEIRQHLLAHVLDMIRIHPNTAIEVCDLISASLLRSGDSQAQDEVPTTLTFALSSLLDEGQREENAKPIASCAHLLALVLQDEKLFDRNVETLRERAGSYIGLLEMEQSVTSDNLPPWLPYVLLLLEMFLCHDERPVTAQWKAPKTLEEEPKPAIFETPNPILNKSQRASMLELLMELLPKIGKEEILANSALRVLVILSRSHELAKTIGDKKNLLRLFLMARQLSGYGSERLKQTRLATYLTTILRHIIEDDEVVRQVMRAEIKAAFPGLQRSARGDPDVVPYLRAMAPVALRSPQLFVEVSNEMLKARRWTDGPKTLPIVLKDQIVEKPTGTDETSTIKPSTEPVDKNMTEVQKPTSDSKGPALENPDGVVHYLLCELLTYRDVEDTEPSTQKDAKAEAQTAASASQEGNAKSGNTEAKDKDKKSSKPVFKAEDHPIFIYRCLILNILTELLQSYQSAKVELIHFRRGQPPTSTHAPLKLRQGMINYLLYDLLCQGNLSGSADTLAAKKKAATASHVQRLFAALVAKTSETSLDRSREKYDYEAEPELLFVRKFVLDTILKAYERPGSVPESLEARYSRMQSLAELMIHMAGDRDREGSSGPRNLDASQARSQAQLRRLMYEQGYLEKLTSSIAEINLSYPNVKRAIKYILRILRLLTDTAKDLSHSNVLPNPNETFADVYSESSFGITEDEREETPDLYRNSALGMMEPRGDEQDASEDEDEDDDEDMYGEEYDDDEMDYGDDDLSDHDDVISDDDEEEMGHMGEIEGLHGEPGLVEVIMDDDDEDDDDEDEDSDMDEDDDESNSDDLENNEPVAFEDEEGNPLEDDGSSGWESESGDDEDDGDGPEDGLAEGIDYEAEVQDIDDGHMHGVGRSLALLDDLDNMARAIGGDEGDFDADELNAFEEHFIEDGGDEVIDVDDDDEDDGGEDMDDEEYIYDDDYPIDDEIPAMPALGWEGGDPSDQDRRLFVVDHRHHRRPMLARVEREAFPPRIMSADRAPLDFRSYFSRHSRHAGNRPPAEDGMNPLLRRETPGQDNLHRGAHQMSLRIPDGLFPGGRGVLDGSMNFLGELMEFLPVRANGHGPLHFHITGPGGPRDMREWNNARGSRHEGRRDGSSQEPGQAVAFSVESTLDRYQEEARMIFGSNNTIEAVKLQNSITALLTPTAMEQEKKLKAEEAEKQRLLEEETKKREEEQRLAREAKAAEEAAAKEKREADEREAAERAAAERIAGQEAHAEDGHEAEQAEPGAMEGVEPTSAVAAESNNSTESAAESATNQPRVMTRIRGEDVDVTELGIDPDYLAALPEEFREEVIAQTVSTRRNQAREEAPTGESTEVFQEFLDALPEELRMEIVQQERQEQRRRNRDENRRQAPQNVGGEDAMAAGSDMDLASILLTFPPELREQILIDQGDELVDQLPPEMAAQARALSAQHQAPPPPPMAHRVGHASLPSRDRVEISGQENPRDGHREQNKPQRRAVVQMLDKAGVATLLRLMFVTQQGSIRSYLFGVFTDVCENRQNRLEVVSSILQILQDGSADMNAVERSFGQLSLKARKQRDKDSEQKTPQGLKRASTSQLNTLGPVAANSETSPLLIVQQCLDLLNDLCTRNPHVPWLFLTEHDIIATNLRRTLSRKGKAKEKERDPKASKFAINSLLTLLDRDLVIESPVIMIHLADVLNRTTLPLQNLERRRREAEKEEKAAAEKSAAAKEAEEPNDQHSATVAGTTQSQTAEEPAADALPQTAAETDDNTTDPKRDVEKKLRSLQPPVIPARNLNLVVRIFVARECSSKTFQNTISTIKNLSCIPGAKETFGQELVLQARQLSENIVKELDALLPFIENAKSGTEIQGVALAKFSPGASEQNKLLRVLTALDHLFDGRKKPGSAEESSAAGLVEAHDLVNSLYHNSTFSAMWEKLSACLRAIRERENMLNVATILLPLIESLMVVCKNAASGDADLTQSQYGKDMVMSSPQPESRTTNLFITFTEEHRRILNELVRNNPKLMSGTFALLVKNPKVLEFDNKRNYFNRSVHSRNSNNQSRASHPALQISVRREHVFHDSFKHLYFKTGDEMKFGKLNIRFNGEEGVDAGGVTREWFQVLARQMFDANYALFIPVSSDRTTFHPNKLSGINDEHLMFFKFIGRIIGKALYEGRVLDCFFSRAVYKRILGKSVSVKDMESFDPDYYKSLVWMLDNDITDIITETFSVEDDEFGITNIVDLIPGGRDIPVTDENKAEYVRLVVEHKLLASVKDQMANFLRGFHDIIPAELISIFNEQELELLISGLPDIDIDDWKANTEYHNYNPSSQQIQWFWRAVRSFDKEERAKLLQFVTGTSKVPLNGFKELEGMNGVNRFNIHRDYGDKDRLPTSHTCFNQLDLPEYDSYDQLRSQIFKAITQGSEGFGFA